MLIKFPCTNFAFFRHDIHLPEHYFYFGIFHKKRKQALIIKNNARFKGVLMRNLRQALWVFMKIS